MTRDQLIGAVAQHLTVPKATVENVLRASFGEIASKLAAGERVDVHGFGSFTAREHKPRKGFNIHTKEPITVPARVRVKFDAAKPLDAAINPSDKK